MLYFRLYFVCIWYKKVAKGMGLKEIEESCSAELRRRKMQQHIT